MTALATTAYPLNPIAKGGRVASDELRRSLDLADDFCGLEAGADRYRLLLLVKRVGKAGGFTPRMVQLLDYYLAFTRDCDWEEGSRPIVYQSLARTALDLGVSERQVQKLEAALFLTGAITWNDSGNHKRYGQRCAQSGRLVYAFGVDLTPLAYLRNELEAKLAEKKLYDGAWMQAKRDISACRRRLRGLLAEWSLREEADHERITAFDRRYDAIAVQIRTHLDLARLRSLLTQHESLLSELVAEMGVGTTGADPLPETASLPEETRKGSCRSETGFVHYKSTTHSSKGSCSRSDAGFQESVAEPSEPTDPVSSSGLAHVTLPMAVSAAGRRLRASLGKDPDWADLVEAAYAVRAELGVSQASWGEACGVLGRTGAALCLLVTERAAEREEDPVRQPAAYFRGLVRRARGGELRLHRSVFGLLERARS